MSFQETRRWLRGAVVAAATPFNEDYSLDLPGLEANIEAMVERGIRTGDGVLLVAAAAGEFPVLSIDERRQVMRASVRAAAGRVPVMASVQHTDVREMVTLLRIAADEGIAGVQLGPTYYYAATEDDLFRLIDAADRATTIPIMAYATWWDGGVTMTPAILRRLAEFEHVDAVKWSAPDTGPASTTDRSTASAATSAARASAKVHRPGATVADEPEELLHLDPDDAMRIAGRIREAPRARIVGRSARRQDAGAGIAPVDPRHARGSDGGELVVHPDAGLGRQRPVRVQRADGARTEPDRHRQRVGQTVARGTRAAELGIDALDVAREPAQQVEPVDRHLDRERDAAGEDSPLPRRRVAEERQLGEPAEPARRSPPHGARRSAGRSA